MDVEIVTFGYLHGDPPPAHLTLDLREHFRDPHVRPELRQMTAHDPEVRETVLSTPGIATLVEMSAIAALAFLRGPSGSIVRIAIGCAGGRHRAATVGMTLSERLSALYQVQVSLEHRDLGKPVVQR